MCRSEAIVPGGGVKDLPNNYFMDNLVNKLILNYKLETETELRCEECDEDNSVVVFCTDCKLFLCHFCKESHKYSKSHCSHNLISLTELRSNKDLIQSKSKFPTCQDHDLELEYYCETCEKLVCVQCTGEHEDHKYDVVKKVASKYQDELKEVTASIEVMMKDISKVHASIEDVRIEIQQQGDEISKQIDLCYDEVIEKLLEQKQQVKQQVNDTILQKEKALERQLNKVMDAQEDILNIKRIRDTIQANSDQEALALHDQLVDSLVTLTEKFEKLGQEPIESANITVTPANEPLPQVVKHFATIDSLKSLSFDVKYSSSIQRGKTTTLKIITKDGEDCYPRGGCKVAVELESSTEEEITVKTKDNNDGTYIIDFTAQQVGEINLSLSVNEQDIKGSPFKIVVQENPIAPSKIVTNEDNSFGKLWGIACSNNGMWAVADWINNCVHVFDSQDKPIKKFGGRGNRNGQFEYPYDVAFDDNNELYVTDSHNHRVQKFDTDGNYLLQFGGKGYGEGQLNYPVGITTHQDKVYVADRGNHRISVFQNDGNFCGVVGKDHLSRFFSITVTIDGEILAADWEHGFIYVFTLDGHYINKIKETTSLKLNKPCNLTTDSNGFIILPDSDNHSICIFDRIGNCIHYFESDHQLKFPCGIAIGCDGSIYISDTGNRRVQIFPAQNL